MTAPLDTPPPKPSDDATRADRRTVLRTVAAIFALAVAVRVGYCVLAVDADRGPAIAGNDDWQYDQFAVSLLAGRGMANLTGEPSAQRLPGYPLLLAGVYAVFGHSYLAARLVHCLLGGVACVLLYALAGRWFSRRVGLIAAGVLAVYPMHLWLAGELLSENLTVVGVLLVLLALDQVRRSDRVRHWMLVGALAGAVGLVHPITAGLVLVLAGMTVLWSLRTGGGRWRSAVAMTLVLAMPIAGWSVRNRLAVGGFSLSSLGGNTFLGANNVITATCPRYYGYWISEWDVPGVREQFGHVRGEVARSRLFGQFALRWLWEHPHYWPRLAIFKLARFYGPLLADWRSRQGLVYLLSYGALLPLIAAGLWVVWRRRGSVEGEAFRPAWVVLGYYTAMVVVYWGAPRFRLTIEPLLITLAAVGALRLTDWARRPTPTVLPFLRWQLHRHDV